MSTTPRISIVLPVRNGMPALAEAIRSIREQTFRDWELVVVDDGSTDATGPWLRQLAVAEPRARLLHRPPEGIVPALNAGLTAARGEFIARMDADDLSHPERLAQQLDLFQSRPDLGVAGSLVAFGGHPQTAAGYARYVDWINSLRTPESIALNRFVESPLAHPSVMFRRTTVERLGGYRQGDFPEDYELWLRWLEAGVCMAKVPQVLLTWNDPPERLSRADARYAPEAFYRCKTPYLARWLEAQVPPERAILVWGAGRPTRKRAEHLTAHGVRISGYVDIDPRKIGQRLGGRPVIAPTNLPPPGGTFILGYVAKHGARELARAHLNASGYREGRDYLMAA